MSTPHGLRFDATRFWVIHRRREYGPFDYQWSGDLCGLELLYCDRKFGEICSDREIFADLREFRLPMRVVTVASIVFGATLSAMLEGRSEHERRRLLDVRLLEFGCERFAS